MNTLSSSVNQQTSADLTYKVYWWTPLGKALDETLNKMENIDDKTKDKIKLLYE